MATPKTITINGRTYDAVTGLPVEAGPISTPPRPVAVKKDASAKAETKPAVKVETKPEAKLTTVKTEVKSDTKPVAKKSVTNKKPLTPRSKAEATTIHSNLQRSQTLRKRAAKKPVAKPKVIKHPATGRHMDIAAKAPRSASVAKFAAHPAIPAAVEKPAVKPITSPAAKVVKPTVKPAVKSSAKNILKPAARMNPKPRLSVKPRPKTVDQPAQPHPVASRAVKRAAAKPRPVAASAPASSKEIKNAAIEKAMNTPKPAARKNKKQKPGWFRPLTIIGSIILVIAIGLFAAYKLIPSISVNIASAQAGIEARYPEYIPDGYSLQQPVTYSEGRVDLTFHSNSNDSKYLISQTRSSWDSSAVLDNIVKPAAGAQYSTTKERGLTIYTYDTSVAWVNRGILYTIDSTAVLSGDQIRRIATSL